MEDVFTSCSGCTFSCDPVDGCIEPTFLSVGTAHSQTVPLSFGNLNNVSKFELNIFPQNNVNQVLRTIKIDNPYTIVSWDGKDNNGSEVIPANYYYILELSNSCETRKFDGVFPKYNSEETNYRQIVMDYLPLVKQDISNDDCCYDTIFITNSVLDFIDPPMNLSEVGGENTLIGTFNIIISNLYIRTGATDVFHTIPQADITNSSFKFIQEAFIGGGLRLQVSPRLYAIGSLEFATTTRPFYEDNVLTTSFNPIGFSIGGMYQL